MNFLRTLATVVLFLLISTTAFAEATLCTTSLPSNARMDQFPLASSPLSMTQIANLRLRPEPLPVEFRGYNHHRELNPKCGGTWVLETIPAGELVLVDQNGYVAYRVSCGNRLVRLEMPVYNTPVIPPAPIRHLRAFWEWLGDAIRWPFYRYE